MNNKGASLIELLVGVSVLAAIITLVVMSLSKASELTTLDLHRRRARTVADSLLESSVYSESGYSTMSGTTFSTVIDSRESGTGDDLNGAVTVTVTEDSLSGTSSIRVPYKEITVVITWSELTQAETLSLSKRVSDL